METTAPEDVTIECLTSVVYFFTLSGNSVVRKRLPLDVFASRVVDVARPLWIGLLVAVRLSVSTPLYRCAPARPAALLSTFNLFGVICGDSSCDS